MTDPLQFAAMWLENTSIRRELRDEIIFLREQLDKAKLEIINLQARVKALEKKK